MFCLPVARSVDEYLADAPIEARPILRRLRRVIKSTVPGVEERISWGVPFYWYQGALAGFAVFRGHVTFGLGGPDLPERMRKELGGKGYVTGKKTIRIRFDQRVPEKEIRRLIRARARLNVARRRKNRKG